MMRVQSAKRLYIYVLYVGCRDFHLSIPQKVERDNVRVVLIGCGDFIKPMI